MDTASPCAIPVWYLSCMLVFLPGSQLIYGAYEIMLDSVIQGASRLVSALIRCMILAAGLTIGWQVFGHNLALHHTNVRAGAAASLPPSADNCVAGMSWVSVFGGYNFPMLFFAFLGLNIRVRDMLGPFSVGYVSLFVFASLIHAKDWNFVSFPMILINIFGMFIGGNLGSLHEYLTGAPSCISIIPVILMLAPGSGAVKSVLDTLQYDLGNGNVVASLWGNLVLDGVAYAVGLYLAAMIWRPFIRKRHIARGINVSNSDMDADQNEGHFTLRV